jgi:hypothetical protein
MPLPSSGNISFGAINVELGLSTATQLSLGGASSRGLAGVASGAIRTAADFYGKSNIPAGYFRYVRWTITAVRTGSSDFQASEFILRNAGADISGMTSATVTSSFTPYEVEPPSALVDGNVNTKCYQGSLTFPISLYFDLGSYKLFDGYRWATANDVTGRDPRSWTVSVSNDNVNWTLKHTVTAYATTTSRNTYVGPFTY